MKKKSLILTFALFSLFSYSQNIDYKNLAKKEGANFYEIVTQTREQFKSLDMSMLQNKKAKKQFERWAYDWTNKINPDGTFPDENAAFYNTGILDSKGKIVKQTETSTSNRSSLSSQNWTNIGPSQTDLNNNAYPNYPQMGRLNAFLRIKHPTNVNQDVLFVGAPNGGIWKSTDNGTTWTPKIDFAAAVGVTDIDAPPGTTTDNYLSRPIYVSTGDYDNAQAKSIGVLKSTDGGETFNSSGLTFTLANDKSMGDLIVIDANTVFVGGPDTIKKTIDGGTTWTDAYDSSLAGRDYGRAAIFGNEIMFTNAWGGIVYSPNYATAPFTNVVADGTGSLKSTVTVGEDGEFYIQEQAGQIKKFNKTNSTFANFGSISVDYNSQQGYNQAIIVKNNFVVTGEFNGNSSTDNGATWTRSLNGYWTSAASPGTYIHSDHHRMGTLDGSLDFWSCNDGGLSYISYPSTTSTTPTITYKTSPVKITQLYSVAINPNANDGATVISNQDNDSMSKFNGQWYAIAQGDGIQSAVNYNIPAIMYAGNQNGAITQSHTGFVGQVNGNGNSVSIPGASFYFPLEMNKTNANVLYGGGTDVSIITATGTTTTDAGTLAIAPANSGVTSKVVTIATHGNAVLAGSVNEIKFSSNGGTSWTNIVKPADASGNITSVEFNGTNAAIMYVTFNGYTDTKKVYKSTDSGANWINISGNLPNIVMNEVLLKQGQASEILFVATNLGVYYTTDGGTAWTKLGQGLPNTDVKDIDIHYTADKLVAGTFGRGLWEINIANNTLGNESFSNELKITVFPNPTTDFINISGENEVYNYVIYNVVGGIVKKGQINTATPIDVKDLATNNYILNIRAGKINKTIKFIKN